MWSPAVQLPPRLALSVLASAGRLRVLKSGAAMRKNPQAGHRGLSDHHPLQLSDPDLEDSPFWTSKSRLDPRRYITGRKLAETLTPILVEKRKSPRQVVLECNPGTGILTQELLKAGARVIALERDKSFIPHLESLGKSKGRQLEVFHCDFFKLDPDNCELPKPPVMESHVLFKNLGIKPFPWIANVPLKVVGVFPIKGERNALWKLLHDIYACDSIYRYGRVELNMFISEKEYQKITASPRNSHLYQVLSVLWQVACEIKVLHVEPYSSFDTCSQNGQMEKSMNRESLEPVQEKLYFIRMTPRRNLFTESLTPINYEIFFNMVKQCFGKRNATLGYHLQSLSPIDTKHILLQTKKPAKAKITEMYPQEFKHLFETIECSSDHTCKWLYDDFMEETVG